MRIDISQTNDLFAAHGKVIEEVLRRAVGKALLEHKRAGNPIAAWQDGQVVIIDAKDISVDAAREQTQI